LKREVSYIFIWFADLNDISLVWHGIDERAIGTLCQTGMATTSKEDPFGTGMYFTHFPSNAVKSTKSKVLLLCWVVQGLIYPVVEDPSGSGSFSGRPGMSGTFVVL
jgi:hypothetical protein